MATNVYIELGKDEIYAQVLLVTGYLGAKNTQDASTYEQIAVSKSQYEMLDRFLDNSSSVLADALTSYAISTDFSDGFSVTMSMPSNWNFSMASDLKVTFMNFLVSHITAQWVRITMDQSNLTSNTNENKYNEDALMFLSQVRKKIHYRVRPKRHERCICETASIESVEYYDNLDEEWKQLGEDVTVNVTNLEEFPIFRLSISTSEHAKVEDIQCITAEFQGKTTVMSGEYDYFDLKCKAADMKNGDAEIRFNIYALESSSCVVKFKILNENENETV